VVRRWSSCRFDDVVMRRRRSDGCDALPSAHDIFGGGSAGIVVVVHIVALLIVVSRLKKKVF
jgi:hypothetical protein